MRVRATFDFDIAEYDRATRPVTRPLDRFIVWVFGGLSVGLLCWNVLRDWREYPLPTLLSNALPFALLVAFWVAFIPYMQRRQRLMLPQSDPSLRGLQVREVDDTGFHSTGNGVTLDVPWTALLKASETEEFFLFYFSKRTVYYIPKHALQPRDHATLRDLVRSKMGARALIDAS